MNASLASDKWSYLPRARKGLDMGRFRPLAPIRPYFRLRQGILIFIYCTAANGRSSDNPLLPFLDVSSQNSSRWGNPAAFFLYFPMVMTLFCPRLKMQNVNDKCER